MRIYSFVTEIGLLFLFSIAQSQAQPTGFGQTIQINTRFHSFVGFPSWTLIVRDLDHNQTIPYVFDITRGRNHWLAYTYGKNYLITASQMHIGTYQSSCNTYRQYRLSDFCHLESRGRIIRGKSLVVTIEGELSPYGNRFFCHVSSYPSANFYTTVPDD